MALVNVDLKTAVHLLHIALELLHSQNLVGALVNLSVQIQTFI